MDVGLNLPQYEIDFEGGVARADAMLDLARLADRLGLDSVWVSDHPFVVGPDGRPCGALEPLACMSALARTVTRARVGVLVLAATMRSPALVSHVGRALGPGRAVVGVGAGWYEPEHRAYGIALPPFPERVSLAGRTLAALRALDGAAPSLLVGGTAPALLALAARHADTWNCSWDAPPEGFAALARRLDEACRAVARDPASLSRSVGVTVGVVRRHDRLPGVQARLRARAPFLASVRIEDLQRRIVVGTPPECADRIAAYGADEVIVTPLLRDDPEMVELLAHEVAPRLRER